MTQWWARRPTVSFRTRLGSLVALAVGLTVAVAALASYFVVRHQLLGQIDSSLNSDVTAAQSLSPYGGIQPNRVADFLGRTNPGGFLQVISSSGIEFPNGGLSPEFSPTNGEEAIAASGHGSRYDTINYRGIDYRVLTQGGTDQATGQPLALQIGRPMGEVEHALSTLRLILWLVAGGGIAAAVILGYLLGRTMLRPVERLTEAAEHVAVTQDLNARIDDLGDDELARLARSFNAMLTALATSRQQQAQLISDAGHELRTPLTSLRTNIEVLMRVPDLPAADRTELVGDVEAQMAELTTLIGDLVDLARHEEIQPEPIEVRLDAIVERAVERVHRRATGLTFDVHLTPGSIRATPALLERAVLNVLDNAAKWSPPNGTIEVWLQRGACWTLDVHDHGPGIAPADLPHVFDRFYRAPTARSMPGSGLGLAIVHQVITDNGGRVSASVPPEGGTLVHIELPIVAEVEAGDAEQPGRGPDEGSSPPPPTAPGPAEEVAWSAPGRRH